MGWLLALAGVFTAAVVYLNVAATIALWKAGTLEPFQKGAQGILVWIVPLFGALVVLHLLADTEPEAVPAKLIGAGMVTGPFGGASADSGGGGGGGDTGPGFGGSGCDPGGGGGD